MLKNFGTFISYFDRLTVGLIDITNHMTPLTTAALCY